MNEEGDSRREEEEGLERGKRETGLGEEEMGEFFFSGYKFYLYKVNKVWRSPIQCRVDS